MYEALAQDTREQGITAPLPSLDDLQLRRTWAIRRGDLSGSSSVGSCVGSMHTGIAPWLWALRSRTAKAERSNEEYLIATHEMTHSVGNVTFTTSAHLLKGFPLRVRSGLILHAPISNRALFHALEEVNACMAEIRAGRRLGLRETTHHIQISALRSPRCFSPSERKRLLSLLEEFSLGEATASGDRVVRTQAPVLERAPGIPYRSGSIYRPLLAGMRTIAHYSLQAESPEKSFEHFSRLLSQAHAGDFSAYKGALRIIRQAIGSEGARLLSLVRPAVRNDACLMPIVAEALKLPEDKRALFLSKLYLLAKGELLLTESLQAGRPPSTKEMDHYISKTSEAEETMRERISLMRFRKPILSGRLKRLAITASAGALARGEPLQAYKILINTHQPRSTWPAEITRELSTIPASARILAHASRISELTLATISKLFKPAGYR